MQNVIITKKQLEAVQYAKKLYVVSEIMEAHANTSNNLGWGHPELKALNDMSVSTLAQVLYTNRYEIKKEFPENLKKGDYVKHKNIINELSFGIFDRLEGNQLYAFFNGQPYSTWVYSSKVEPSTKEEYELNILAKSKKAKEDAFSKLGRALNEVRVGDVIIVDSNVILRDCGDSNAFHVHNEDVLVKAKHVVEKNLFTELFTPKGVIKSEKWLNK